jgi:toxin-antitoxin system PIN domain toxin
VILVDANILLYAENSSTSINRKALNWWCEALSGTEPVCLCWEVIIAFIRIGTNPRVYNNPLTLNDAIKRVQGWLDQPCTRIIYPTDRHWDVFTDMLFSGQASANLVSDAHLAALAIEHNCVMCSTDKDFKRFPKLKYKNPLE